MTGFPGRVFRSPLARICLFYLAVLFLFTFPLPLLITTHIYGLAAFPGDTLGALWGMWWTRVAAQEGLDLHRIPILAVPFGVDWSGNPINYGFEWLLRALSGLLPEVMAYNLFFLSNLLLSGLAMAWLAFWLTKDWTASALAGLVFMLSPNLLMHGAAGHLGHVQAMWLPLYTLSLLRLMERQTVGSGVLAGLGFFAVVMTNYYYGFFMAIFTGAVALLWGGYRAVAERRVPLDRSVLVASLAAVVIAIVSIVPFTYQIILAALRPGEVPDVALAGYVRPYMDLYKYAARPWDYLLPSELHPLWGGAVETLLRGYLDGPRHFFERSLYLGLVPLVLAGAAISLWARRTTREALDPRTRFAIPLFAASGLLMGIFSMAPVLELGGLRVPNLSYFLYPVAPMFRVYARLGVVVALCASVLAALGLRWWLGTVRGPRRVVAVGGLALLIMLDYANFPPQRVVDVSARPAHYQWLASRDAPGAVVEYPWVSSHEERNTRYVFYQRVHGRPMLNGALLGSTGDRVRRSLADLFAPEVPSVLRAMGARYVLVHKDAYDVAALDRLRRREGLRLLRDFPEVALLEVAAEPAEVSLAFGRNFYGPERWPDGKVWRWMTEEGQLLLLNWSGRPRRVDLELEGLSFARSRAVRIQFGGQTLAEVTLKPDRAERFRIEGLELRGRETAVTFLTEPGMENIHARLGSGDRRDVSIALAEPRLLRR